MFDNSDAPSLELLRFRPELAHLPGFEAALRDHVQRLDRFRHPAFARVRAVQRLEPDDDLALISNCTPGKRLSEVLHQAQGPAFAGTLVQQLAPALIDLQQHGADISHGLLSPDRIVVSPDGRLTIVEHVVGPAIEALNLGAAQLESIGIALPPAPEGEAPRLDVATDWYQLGLVALSVLAGRPVTTTELPQIERLLDNPGVSRFMRQWLDRALQMSGSRIESGADARAALDELLQAPRPGSPRRLESRARQEDAPAAPAAASRFDPVAPLAGEVAETRAGVIEPTPPVAWNPEPAFAPVELFPLEQPPVRPPETEPSIPEPRTRWEPPRVSRFVREWLDRALQKSRSRIESRVQAREALDQSRDRESSLGFTTLFAPPVSTPKKAAPAPVVRPQWEVRQRPPQIQPLDPQRLSLFEQQMLAGKKPHFDSTRPTLHERHAAPHAATPPRPGTGVRSRISTGVFAAVALLALAEAGVIAVLARELWASRQPPLVVQAGTSDDKVVVSSRSTEAPPLRLAVAPDLSWVRVSSAPSGEVGGKKVASGQAGTIRIASPIRLQVFEQSRQLGSVPGADLKLPAGRHEIELVNRAFGYHLRQTLDVEAGQTVSIQVAPPPGLATFYATPDADVSIDGQRVGRTPLGPMPLALGEHQVTFHHGSGAWDRQRVTVTSGATVRVIGKPRR
jgi:hypothetical protein